MPRGVGRAHEVPTEKCILCVFHDNAVTFEAGAVYISQTVAPCVRRWRLSYRSETPIELEVRSAHTEKNKTPSQTPTIAILHPGPSQFEEPPVRDALWVTPEQIL